MDKTLYFHTGNDFTGSTQVLANLFENIPSHITIICNNNNNGCLSRLPNVHIISDYRPSYKGRDIPLFSTFFSKMQLFALTLWYGRKFDTFYINTIRPYYAAIVGKILRKEIVWHIHEKYVNCTRSSRFYEFIFNHTKAKRIFVSRYLRDQYPYRDDCPTEIVYNKLPTSFLHAVQITPISERKKVTMIASFSRTKGIYTLKEVAAILPAISFQLIMNASLKDVEHFMDDGCPANLKVFPRQSNIHPFLRETSLMLNLSIPLLWVETFGMTILEAMVYGIPSIAPNVGGPLELIENGVNGYCIDVTNVQTITKTIMKCLNPLQYARLSEGCIYCFNQKFK